MARPTNRQSRSVGNLGDVLKHGVLIELASKLAQTCATVRYVDTHTFLLHAPFADLPRWNREIDELSSEHAGNARYAALERASLTRRPAVGGHYRCSSGLMLDVFGDRRGAFVLGEANGATRAELKGQIREEEHRDIHVADDAAAALRYACTEGGGPVLIHVDPFSLSAELWASLSPALDGLCEGSTEVALVVYRYTRNARSPWPMAPQGTHGPVAQTRGGPHELAAYASPNLTDAVRGVCASLGWQLER